MPRTPKIVEEIVRGQLSFEHGDGVTIIHGENIEAKPHQNLNICFNGRTYHAEAGAYANFRAIVPAFEGEVEVYLNDKQNPQLVARGVA